MMLDDMEDYFEGPEDNGHYATFPESYFEETVQCFNKFDNPLVMQAQDAGWRKFLEYYFSDEAVWDDYPEEDKFAEYFIEKDKFFGRSNLRYEITEPCNYASNAAYYGSAIRVCDKEWKTFNVSSQAVIMRCLSVIAVASSWFHGSLNNVGARWDGKAIEMTINVAYQLAISSVSSDSTIFRAGSNEFNQTPIVELSDPVVYLPLNDSLPIDRWFEFLNTLPISDGKLELQAAALFHFSCAATMPFVLCETVMGLLAPALSDPSFLIDVYTPELKTVAQAENFPMPLRTGLPLFCQGLSVMIGFIYSIVFQEKFLPLGVVTDSAIFRAFVSAINPLVEGGFRLFHNIRNSEKKGYNGNKDVYPGADFCNKHSAHALWHQKAASGLFEIFVYADDINEAVRDYQKTVKGRKLSALQSTLRWLRSTAGSISEPESQDSSVQ
ncbi:expressed unknown protein [Seminavis robusta]|uniref:Uncharacterized protein n=1 Tax=Seminavis robusta TaxID=568900 RepID=A0A9N8H8Y1_9STRA|nr:expressed unknown protein [Seminavis robusta]|eukprot:Sro185_g080340.1 n/a (439) ;mRNA; r:48469-49785